MVQRDTNILELNGEFFKEAESQAAIFIKIGRRYLDAIVDAGKKATSEQQLIALILQSIELEF
jgi:hypothetical protein